MYKCSFEERKISKRMKLIKRVRENYVRDDIPCGFDCCMHNVYDDFVVFSIITEEIMKKNIALLKSEFIRPIICHSIFQRLSHGEQRKIKELVNTKKYFIFYDNFCSKTCGRGVEGVLEYYSNHLPEKKFVILNEDNLAGYSQFFGGSKEVEDLVMNVKEAEETVYEEYYKSPEALLNEGRLIRSKLMVDAFSWFNGSVFENNKRIRILGRKNMNRAIHGDEVYVELIEEVVEDALGDIEEDFEEQKINIEKNENTMADVLFGKVVGIHKRSKTELIGTIINNTVSGDGPQNVLVLPVNKKYPPIRIRTGQVDELVNKRLMVELEEWEIDSRYPTGHYFKKLYNLGDKEGEIECILLSNGVNYFKDRWVDLFAKASTNFYDLETLKVLRGEESEFYSLIPIYQEVQEGLRRDLRHLKIFSIDPQGCTDVDDTMHVKVLENGNYEFGVHIADVTQYVKPDSLLDKIAQDRSTTVYLPDRRIDMLPEFLSAGLCSLLENQERAAFSVIWEVDVNMKILKRDFFKSLIKSRKAFSYEEALRVIENEPSNEFYKELVQLSKASQILRERRLEGGALDLSTSKYERVDGKLVLKDQLSTYSLVEEFMLLANIAVAEFIYENVPEKSLLRKHPPPSSYDLLLPIDISSTKNINNAVKDFSPEQREVFKKVVTKTMNQAIYILSDESSDFFHYGLAVSLYTHFTSPIRRYADVVVHRLLTEVIFSKIDNSNIPSIKRVKQSQSSSISREVVDNINFRHNSAKRCGWDSAVLFTYLAIREIEPETVAFVTEIKANGIIVNIPEFGLDTYIMVEGEFNVFDKLTVKINKDDELFFVRRRFNITIL
ncbi:Exosome complex exonuclease dis3 [Nosema granulosis]|uniref:Exosome complex exonuclease dis3 n=1 Tax=Nosema granulosis TaxID=83296 RepID=A0A9P6GX71_9MICR|nr:Exosome complex exonuclease dis3 [Nosema granulosis]